MTGRLYYRSLGQSDASRGVKLPVNRMREWPQWAFDAYAWGWLHQRGEINGD